MVIIFIVRMYMYYYGIHKAPYCWFNNNNNDDDNQMRRKRAREELHIKWPNNHKKGKDYQLFTSHNKQEKFLVKFAQKLNRSFSILMASLKESCRFIVPNSSFSKLSTLLLLILLYVLPISLECSRIPLHSLNVKNLSHVKLENHNYHHHYDNDFSHQLARRLNEHNQKQRQTNQNWNDIREKELFDLMVKKLIDSNTSSSKTINNDNNIEKSVNYLFDESNENIVKGSENNNNINLLAYSKQTNNNFQLEKNQIVKDIISDFNNNNKNTTGKLTIYKIITNVLDPILLYIDYIYGFVFIIGLIGNLTVIYFIAVKSNKSKIKFERVTDFYICNLAGADLMFISGLPFIIMRDITGRWLLGDLACKMYMSSTSLNQFASSFLLVAMGFDRFMVVCIPIYAHKFRQLKSAVKICGLIWLISIPLMSPIFIYSKLENNTLCTIGWPDSAYISYGVAFTMYSFALGFAVPLLLIAGFYLSILRKLRMRTNLQFNTSSARKARNMEARNRKTEHLVVVIICTYTICWSPYWICQFIISLVDEKDVDPMVYNIFVIATSLSYANSAFNPIIYAFLNENFKRRYVESSFFLVKFFQRYNDKNNQGNKKNSNASIGSKTNNNHHNSDKKVETDHTSATYNNNNTNKTNIVNEEYNSYKPILMKNNNKSPGEPKLVTLCQNQMEDELNLRSTAIDSNKPNLSANEHEDCYTVEEVVVDNNKAPTTTTTIIQKIIR